MDIELKNKIVELWHISRTALAGKSTSKHDRMLYIQKNIIENHRELMPKTISAPAGSAKQLWFEISEATTVFAVSSY